LRFLAQGDYADFIVKEANRSEFIQEVFVHMWDKRRDWDVLELYNIPEYSQTLFTLQEVNKDLKLDLNISQNIAFPTMIIDGDPDFVQDCLKKKSMIRHYNYFHKNGDLTFHRMTDRQEMKRQLEFFFQQHIERRQLAHGQSLFLNPEVKHFYYQLIENIPSDWLEFSMVKFNDEPIAYHFGFFYSGKYVWYKPAFNVSYAKRSPGEVLLRFLIQRALDHKSKEFDFTIGDETFKQRFSNHLRYNYKIEIISNKRIKFYWKSIDVVKNLFKKSSN
jgi:hypothetical protein